MSNLFHFGHFSQVIGLLKSTGLYLYYDYEKHRLYGLDADNHDEKIVVRVPIQIVLGGNNEIEEDETTNMVVLIQSGHAALGLFHGMDNIDHKVITAYMVRKKQGKSQIKYLKSKGKSRAGSRVRLAESVEFFENINLRQQGYFEDNKINRIALSCSKTLYPFLFSSKIDCPYNKNDKRIYRIPRHVHTPKYEVMLDTFDYISKGEFLKMDGQYQGHFEIVPRSK